MSSFVDGDIKKSPAAMQQEISKYRLEKQNSYFSAIGSMFTYDLLSLFF